MRPLIHGASKLRGWKCRFTIYMYTQLTCVSKIIYMHSLLCRKDVSLPQDMQRAMAAEAEATREANAKVYTQWNLGIKDTSV